MRADVADALTIVPWAPTRVAARDKSIGAPGPSLAASPQVTPDVTAKHVFVELAETTTNAMTLRLYGNPNRRAGLALGGRV